MIVDKTRKGIKRRDTALENYRLKNRKTGVKPENSKGRSRRGCGIKKLKCDNQSEEAI